MRLDGKTIAENIIKEIVEYGESRESKIKRLEQRYLKER